MYVCVEEVIGQHRPLLGLEPLTAEMTIRAHSLRTRSFEGDDSEDGYVLDDD
jgi:hypothetical protein